MYGPPALVTSAERRTIRGRDSSSYAKGWLGGGFPCLAVLAGIPSVFLLLTALFLSAQAQKLPLSGATDNGIGQSSLAAAALSQIHDFEQHIAYWTTEPGWHTELQLRNNLQANQLTVTPVVRVADGTETTLSQITINSGDVVSVDVARALQKIAPELVGSYGSMVLRYSAPVHRALYPLVVLHVDGQPIMFHLDANFHSSIPGRASREGIWWLPRGSVNDLLVLSNSGAEPLNPRLTLYDASGRAWSEVISLGPWQTQRLSVRPLLQQAGLNGSYGGIKIDGVDTAGYLESAYLLFDEQGGFSAMMKMFSHDPTTTLFSRSLAAFGSGPLALPCWLSAVPIRRSGFRRVQR